MGLEMSQKAKGGYKIFSELLSLADQSLRNKEDRGKVYVYCNKESLRIMIFMKFIRIDAFEEIVWDFWMKRWLLNWAITYHVKYNLYKNVKAFEAPPLHGSLAQKDVEEEVRLLEKVVGKDIDIRLIVLVFPKL
ncbi:hypothetical protein SUGI_0010390 [Cryptomeria japonica]|nr:hypothetical protein SUGI_0010390 [Cryptomeria japonica]